MATTRDLNGAVVALVGATGGLGAPIGDRLRTKGADVIAINRSGSRPDRPVELVLDVRDPAAGDALIDHVHRTRGRLDGVIVAAGIVAFGELTETDDITVEELFLTNSMGPIWLARRVAPALAESAGFFLNVSGVVASMPTPRMAAYSASKAAAASAMQALRGEWRRKKITVTDVQPPHTETGLATRPLAGTAPSMPEGLAPTVVADRIVDAIERGETQVSADDFG